MSDKDPFNGVFDEYEDGEVVGETTVETEEKETETTETESEEIDYKKLYEDQKKSYENLRELQSKQATELGELRKGETPKDSDAKEISFEEFIKTADLDNVNEQISVYEKYLSQKDIAITDSENFSAYNMQYQKLLAQQVRLEIADKGKQSSIESSNQIVIDEYKKQWDTLTPEQMTEVVGLAKKISGTGTLTAEDMEAATLRKFPREYRQKLADETADKERQRMRDAQAKMTTRMPDNGTGKGDPAGLKPLSEILMMDEDTVADYLDTLSDDQVAKVEKLLKQHK